MKNVFLAPSNTLTTLGNIFIDLKPLSFLSGRKNAHRACAALLEEAFNW